MGHGARAAGVKVAYRDAYWLLGPKRPLPNFAYSLANDDSRGIMQAWSETEFGFRRERCKCPYPLNERLLPGQHWRQLVWNEEESHGNECATRESQLGIKGLHIRTQRAGILR